jgi:hypothetical protein
MLKKVRDFDYVRVEDGIKKDPYDDKKMKDTYIDFAKNTLGIQYEYGTTYGIDLIRTGYNYGAEGENASYHGDRWTGIQRNIFGLNFNTLNMQNSKWHYNGLQELSDKNSGKYLIPHPGFEYNNYFRINLDYDQICIAEADVIRDFNKIKFVLNRKVSNSRGPEDWICIPEEYVKTYNKQLDGTWVLNGKYCGLSDDERKLNDRYRATQAFLNIQKKKNN